MQFVTVKAKMWWNNKRLSFLWNTVCVAQNFTIKRSYCTRVCRSVCPMSVAQKGFFLSYGYYRTLTGNLLELEPIGQRGHHKATRNGQKASRPKNGVANTSKTSKIKLRFCKTSIGSHPLPIVCRSQRYGVIIGKDRNGHRRRHIVSQPSGDTTC